MSVRTTEQVVDVGRHLVSASHIIQARSDLFIVKTEAYVMNRKKKEKSVLREEGHVYVLDLFVKVPSGAAAPSKYTPTQSIKWQTEENKGSEFHSTAANQLFDGRSERGRNMMNANSCATVHLVQKSE